MSDEAAPAVSPTVTPTGEAAPSTETPAIPDAAVKPPAPPPEPTDTYIVDGVEKVLTRTQARTLIQKAGAVDRRIQEAAEERGKAEALLKLFEEDPEAALAKIGKDPTKVLEAYLAKKAKLELMSPEQREKHKLEEELAAERAKLKAIEDERRTKAQEEQDAKVAESLEAELIAAADAHQLDRTPETLEMMADVALELVELGLQVTPNQVAAEVARRQTEYVEARDKKVLSRLTDDAKLLAYLGPELVKRVKAAADEASLKKIPGPTAKAKSKTTALPPREEKGRFMKESDFDRKFGFRK